MRQPEAGQPLAETSPWLELTYKYINYMKKIVILGSLLLLVLAGCSFPGLSAKDVLSPEDAKAKVEEFINTNLMNPGNKATITEITEEGDLYKIVVNVGEQNIDSYMSKDGKKFFPQVMDITKDEATPADNNQDDSQVQIDVKKDKPEVELFVMSHCPFGTQIEKGILPVLEALGDKINFELKFCDYAMHGETELDEQLNQYCIQKEQPDKFLSYLKCFLEDGDSDRCLNEVDIDMNKIDVCVVAADKESKVKEQFADKSTWKIDSKGNPAYPLFNVYKADNDKYGVGGSPTLVINGEQISSNRDSASLLNTICAGFNEAPEQCSTKLSTSSPSPGFGSSTGGSTTGATCN